MTSPQFIQKHHADNARIREELSAGLLQTNAHISPKYLYDPLGSRLFEAITCLTEYYPTRTEASILSAQAQRIAQQIPRGSTLIDLGAGNCEKAARLFDVFHPAHYVAVDISVEFLRGSVECLQRQFPHLRMSGLGIDFSETLDLPTELDLSPSSPRLLFYPGSSIGNFTPADALNFLTQARAACGNIAGSGILIGVDLVKDPATLEAAYDDALGVTAAFNRNLLLHLNTLLGSNFDIAHWKHVALYNAADSRIEMHLECLQDVTVQWPGLSAPRQFRRGERIHTENSCKWTIERFTALLESAGFVDVKHYTDDKGWFGVFLAHVRKPD